MVVNINPVKEDFNETLRVNNFIIKYLLLGIAIWSNC